jgi:hypothetical protein
MAAEKADLRDVNFRQWFPWMELFRTFQVALDPTKKLLLAAAGLLLMAFGWWLLSVIFYASRERPEWSRYQQAGESRDANWQRFKEDLRKWIVLHEAAGDGPLHADVHAYDLADNPGEVEEIRRQLDAGASIVNVNGKQVAVSHRVYGTMRAWPWSEDRGPNPYLLVTGQANAVEDGSSSYGPWERGRFWDWLLTKQVPVLIEPLVKFFRPVQYLLHPHAGFWNRVYFALALVWALAVWALFGAAITRMAVVQVARRERIGLGEAVRFAAARYVSFLSAPLFPLLCVLVVVMFLIVFGLFHMIPVFGDIVVDGLGWVLVLFAGLGMAVVLVGLLGWPMMYATISAEGSDSFDAVSRSYSYFYQSFWHYVGYALLAIVYGVIAVFIVGFMGSLAVYLGKWGVSQTPFLARFDRQPDFLFIYAPTSFGWRDLLLSGGPALQANGALDPDYLAKLTLYNKIGAGMVAIWLYLGFMLIVGFAYSFFWCASTIIYLLMRRRVDDTEMDEVYLEDEETEEPYPTSPATSAPGSASAPPSSLTMVEAPTLKTPGPAASSPPRSEAPTGLTGDGNPPGESPASA